MDSKALARRAIERAIAQRDGLPLPMSDADRALVEATKLHVNAHGNAAIILYDDETAYTDEAIGAVVRRMYPQLTDVLYIAAGDL